MKDFFVWNDTYSVDIPEIDEQHFNLIQMINELYNAYLSNTHQDVIGAIINGLVIYSKEHFLYEEKFFINKKKELVEKHLLEHQNFLQKVEDFTIDYKKNNKALTFKVITFLQTWLKDHILGMDKETLCSAE